MKYLKTEIDVFIDRNGEEKPDFSENLFKKERCTNEGDFYDGKKVKRKVKLRIVDKDTYVRKWEEEYSYIMVEELGREYKIDDELQKRKQFDERLQYKFAKIEVLTKLAMEKSYIKENDPRVINAKPEDIVES
jgi:hypothetical protein